MAIVYDGALFTGPEPDISRYYTAPMGTTPTGDFAIFALVRVPAMYLGDPSANQANAYLPIAQTMTTLTAGTGGGDNFLRFIARNAGVGNQGKPEAKLSIGGVNVLTAGGSLTGSSVFSPGDTVVMVLQSNAGTIELKTCKPGGATVLEASGARNPSFGAKALGSFLLGLGFANTIQAFGLGTKALADADVQSIANGADPESIFASTERTALWLLNSTAPSIASSWGGSAATRVGDWSGQPVRSPVIPSASVTNAVRLTNEPPVYGAVGLRDDATNPTRTWQGTYDGVAPTAMQARIENVLGGDVVPWTDLGSFTASGGTWSGTLTVPKGGLYRVQVRDKNDPTRIWKGAAPWSCCPITVSLGQSPMVYFERTYKGAGSPALTGIGYIRYPGVNQLVKATAANVGPGMVEAINAFYAATGQPWVAVFSAVVGTSSTQWATKDPAVGWSDMLAALDLLTAKRVLFTWLNGAADSLTSAQIKANHDTIIANLDADVTTARGIAYRYVILPHNRDTGNVSIDRTVRVAQYEWARDHTQAGTKVLLGPWWPDMQTDGESSGLTLTAATATTATLAANDVISTSSTYVGAPLTIVSGTGAGQTRTITAYNVATRVATVAAWTTTPDATSVYRIAGNTTPHPNLVGVKRFGPRYAIDVAAKYGLAPGDGRGPVPTSAIIPTGSDGSEIYVVFTHAHGGALRTPNGGLTATGLAGFEVSEDNFATTKTIAAAIIHDSQTAHITLAAAPADKTQIKVRYGAREPVTPANFDAVGGGLGDLLYDDTGTAPTAGLPAYFTTADLPAIEGAVPIAAVRLKTWAKLNGAAVRFA